MKFSPLPKYFQTYMIMGSESNKVYENSTIQQTSVPDATWTQLATFTVQRAMMKTIDSQIRSFFLSFEASRDSVTIAKIRVLLNNFISGIEFTNLTALPTYIQNTIALPVNNLNADNVVLIQGYQHYDGWPNSYPIAVKNIVCDARYVVIEK